MKRVIMDINRVRKHFPMGKSVVLKAVDDVSLQLYEGETLGIVGESGCGKSTLGRTIVRLYRPTSGSVHYEGKDVHRLKRNELKRYRQRVQMIFQDPHSSLNPRMTVQEIVGEGLSVQGLSGKERLERVGELLQQLGLHRDDASRYPHEFSGGQRQRIGIARALAVRPRIIVADEPISALDVSIQAQIINLLVDLQRAMDLTYIFIAHDLAAVKYISGRIAVMYQGKVVELAPTGPLCADPLHPYTRVLLSAIPSPDPGKALDRIVLAGEMPSPLEPHNGCVFHSRCPYASERCRQEAPALREVSKGRYVACHLHE